MKLILSLFFKILGWKVIDKWPREINKGVVIGMPHTSNWDFFICMAAFHQIKVPIRFTIKKEWMKFPFSILLNKLGAFPIDRSHKKGTVAYITDYILGMKKEESFMMVVTPEGTRSKVKKLKSGFYQIALNAKIPILIGFADYEKKETGISGVVYPSGDYEADLKKILSFYKDVKPKNPELFSMDIGV